MTKSCNTEPKQDNCLVRLKAPDLFKGKRLLSDKFSRELLSPERTVDVSRQYAAELLEAGWHEIRPTPELDVQPYMIEPMTRPGGAGYVPLSSALLWIMTKGEPETKNLTDAEAWQAAVDLLLPLIRTGEVEIAGRPEGIKRQMFAGAAVSGPLNDRARPGCERWICSMPYVDPQMWDEGGFNDQLYLRVSGSAAFTHLEVRKSDMLREFVFPNADRPPAVSTKAGRGKVPLVIKLLAKKFPIAKYPKGVPPPPEAPRKAMITDLLKQAPALGGKLDDGTLKIAIDRYNQSL